MSRKLSSPLERQRGAAALEYILVTTFAAVATIAALVYIGQAVQEQLSRLGSKLGLSEAPSIDLDFTQGGGD